MYDTKNKKARAALKPLREQTELSAGSGTRTVRAFIEGLMRRQGYINPLAKAKCARRT